MQLPDFIDIERTENYSLLIRIRPQIVEVCIYKPYSGENFYYEQIDFPSGSDLSKGVQQLILDSDFLTLPYGHVNVIYVSRDYDLVPNYIIQKDKKDILYNFTHSTHADQILYGEDIIQQIATVYNVNGELYQFLSRNLNHPVFYHHSNLLMVYLEQRNKEQKGQAKMYIHFHNQFMDMLCYDKSSHILHVVTHEGENDKNLVYHILNMWDKCGFDQYEDSLFILSGSAEINLYVPSMLSEYIKNIKQIRLSGDSTPLQNNRMNKELPLDMLIVSAR